MTEEVISLFFAPTEVKVVKMENIDEKNPLQTLRQAQGRNIALRRKLTRMFKNLQKRYEMVRQAHHTCIKRYKTI